MTIDILMEMAKHLKSIEAKQMEQENLLKTVQNELKRKADAMNNQFTIQGYANLHNIYINYKTAAYLSRKAARLTRDKGYRIGSVTHPVFGRVNTYHADILDAVFDEAGL